MKVIGREERKKEREILGNKAGQIWTVASCHQKGEMYWGAGCTSERWTEREEEEEGER